MTGLSIIYHNARLRLALVLLIIAGAAAAVTESRADVIDVAAIKTWQKKLSEATTADDSITALYNLFDIALRNDSGVYSMPLIELCERTKDYDIELDIIRKAANKRVRDTAFVASLYKRVANLPPDEDQHQTLIFIEARSLDTKLLDMDYSGRLQMLQDFVERYRDDASAGIYDRTLALYKLTIALGYAIGGDLHTDYMDRLELLVKELPDSLGPVPMLFYTQAAYLYSRNGQPEKSVKANKRFLNIVEALKADNEARGYNLATYNNYEYVALRRLLVDYALLTDSEIDRYYNRIQELVEADSELRTEYETVGRAHVYYLLAKKRYPEAIEALQKVKGLKSNEGYKLRMQRELIAAAEATGNRELLSQSRREYIDMLEEVIAKQQDMKIKELQLLIDVNNHSLDRIEELTAEKTELAHSRDVAFWTLGMVAVLALVALGVVLIRTRGRRCQRRM